ncbi:type II toxin-antitoxin system RelE/ParE family toxin [Nodosilinea sp. LEGE 06152]|uniref:type II toxin-antitoxin system RelE family toxin n=1 Tax=Nodosilinea sp. LEGE 06152 TaxID=2777966 RepID=UPI00187ECD3B|nr:type II toxin-antitoxin system RelE/ParE family toxin [Nodosilinea sp. LEGE 06152]MBE9158014.1 type II toxin-antitoxin system RelE/ParE family toxin [Nodosilinea sp. LEGE 06152]
MPNNSPVQVNFTDRFAKELHRLAKRYRQIQRDIRPIIERLQAGEALGDKIPNLNYTVFKVRVRNTDTQKGKSGGYRILYYLKTETQILLITIYSKSDRADISVTEIQDILNRAENDLNG